MLLYSGSLSAKAIQFICIGTETGSPTRNDSPRMFLTSETAEMDRQAYDLAQRWGWPEYRTAFRGVVTDLLAKP